MHAGRKYIDDTSRVKVSLVVQGKHNGRRIDSYLSHRFPDYSRTFFASLIRDGRVFVNDVASKPSYQVMDGDKISLDLPEIKEIEITPQKIDFGVIYEDEFLCAINKPPGLIIHPGSGRRDGTLVNGLVYYMKNISGVGDKIRPGIVHRIDKDTSGVLLVAKEDATLVALSDQFKRRTLFKEYQTIVEGIVEFDENIIDLPIGKDRRQREKMAIRKDAEGKPAVSSYKTLERFDGFSLVNVSPKTGRTHQIRVHMKAIGHPLVVDDFYGNRGQLYLSDLTGQPRGEKELPIQNRLTLHAWRITFEHPRLKKQMTLEAPLPDDMDNLLKTLRKYRPFQRKKVNKR